MKRMSSIIAAGALLCLLAGVASAEDTPRFQKLQKAMDSLAVMEGAVFAPKTYEKAADRFQSADSAIKSQKSVKVIDKYLSEAEEYAENAFKTADVARLTFKEYTDARDKARAAQAPALVPELYRKAEEQFIKATQKAEDGDVQGGLKEARVAMPLFDTAELEAIRVSILGSADSLISRASLGEAVRYAPTTLDKARTARARADAMITKDRYERTESVADAELAAYEARHAAAIAQSVRSLERNDQAWEKLMLVYEIQMSRVGEAMGIARVPFDNGPTSGADTLVTEFKRLQSQYENAATVNRQVTERLKATLGRLNLDQAGDDPLMLAERLDIATTQISAERERLANDVASERAQLSDLQQSHQEVSAQLEAKTAEEERFKKAKGMLSPAEGEMLYNAANDVVLRLIGISFDVNKAEIKPEHIPLLEKVRAIIQLYPESKLVIEGHTDASGDARSNTQLSEKRAYAVMQYLRESLLIGADRVNAIGYGAEKPVASNETPEGRAKNRRIDIIIMK